MMDPTKPFGEVCCEYERQILGKDYQSYFFDHAPFNFDSLDRNNYLIVGRRGCGKTSLAEFFKFQTEIPNSACIKVDEPSVYTEVSQKAFELLNYPPEIAIPKMAEMWEYAIWSLIFETYKDCEPTILSACIMNSEVGTPSSLLQKVFSGLLARLIGENGQEIADCLDAFLNARTYEVAIESVLRISPKKPIFVAIDSMDHYSVENPIVMWSTAALVQCASHFNNKYARFGIHIKLFLTDEIFPHLQEKFIMNPLKHVREPLFLHWRPKDLARLVCWRFYKYLAESNPDRLVHRRIDWDNFQDVHEKMWIPYFGETIENRNGLTESTFPYVLRHSQMRPRQLIVLCNAIAKEAQRQKTFPRFNRMVVLEAVWRSELHLANEVLNAYSHIYPNISHIVEALSGLPMTFKGNELDNVARRTASRWPKGRYSLDLFRQVVTELGIVGRRRGLKDERTGIMEADFEFAMDDRLFVHEQDDCAIHPMFYRKLNIGKQDRTSVYPFPDRPDYEMPQGARR